MNKLNKVVTVIAKVAEIAFWVLCGLLLIVMVAALIGRSTWIEFFHEFVEVQTLVVNGFEIDFIQLESLFTVRAIVLITIAGILGFVLDAMIFRNIYLIFRTAAGKTSFSKGETPFQPDIIRMVREIGYFSIAIPVVQIFMSILARIVIRSEFLETSVSLTGVVMGLVVLALSQFFAYGAQLQSDVDGLV